MLLQVSIYFFKDFIVKKKFTLQKSGEHVPVFGHFSRSDCVDYFKISFPNTAPLTYEKWATNTVI